MVTKKYKIIYEREGCIGAAACVAAAADFFDLDDEGKAKILEGKEIAPGKHERKVTEVAPGVFECEFDEEQLQRVMNAAVSCPTNVIHIIDCETEERLI